MTQTLTFTGWAQPTDALRPIVGDDALFYDYRAYRNFDELAKAVKAANLHPDITYGWSLGGQVAMRLLAAGALKTNILVLLATSYQFIANDNVPDATPQSTFDMYYTGFSNFPEMTMRTFETLLLRGDSKADALKKMLAEQKTTYDGWLEWLDELGRFSCRNIDCHALPKTLIIHGKNDAVTPVSQANMLMASIRSAALLLLDNCGHMPHLHDPERIRLWIEEVRPALAYVR